MFGELQLIDSDMSFVVEFVIVISPPTDIRFTFNKSI